MNTINKSLIAGFLILFAASSQMVWAQEEESPREVCAANAKAEGIPAAELEDYIQSCLDSMSGGSEVETQDSTSEGSAQ